METPCLYVALHMGAPKPFLQVACACERVIFDHEDKTPSIIRIINRFVMEFPYNWPEKEPYPPLPFTLFVSFTSGGYEGSGKISVIATRPSGEKNTAAEMPASLNGTTSQNHHSKVSITIGQPMEGTYWFDVLWNAETVARIPIAIEIKRQPPPAKSPTQQGEQK